MGRPRKKGRNVPPGVYFGKGRWFLRTDGRETRLAGADAQLKDVWDAYLLVREIDNPDRHTLEWLCNLYLAGPQFKTLAPATQRDYESCRDQICGTPLKDGSGTFGSIMADAVDPPMVAKYRNKRAIESPSRANREMAFLSVVFSVGVEEGNAKTNPVKGVRRVKLKARKRCPTDEEYGAVYDRAPEIIQIGMELAYLCRLRWSEIYGTDLNDKHEESAPGVLRHHIEKNGLRVVRGKGSKTQVISWTPRLQAVVNRAHKLPSTIGTMQVIHDRKGQKIRYDAFRSAWETAMSKAVKEAGIEPFHFHDLKRKGTTEAKGDKLAASGHKSAAMLPIYDVSVPEVDPTK